MSKKFVKNESADFVVIPGVGKIRAGTILEGDEYAKFAPRYLTEVPEMPDVLPLESTKPSGPQVLVEPKPPVFVEPSKVETPVAPEKPLLTEDQVTASTEMPAVSKARNSKPPKA